jgi:hypothetical protein
MNKETKINLLLFIILILILVICIITYFIIKIYNKEDNSNILITGKYKNNVFNALKETTNLCTTDKNFYPICLNNLGIPRCFMPQFENNQAFVEFEEALKNNNIDFVNEEINPFLLRATQREIDSEKVFSIIDKQLNDPSYFTEVIYKYNPIMVSNDNYVIDGHHRWASLLVYNLKYNKNEKLKIKKYNAPIRYLLKISNSLQSIEFKDC